MYYEVTITYHGTTVQNKFKIDSNEIHEFIRFIIKRIDNLDMFLVVQHPAPDNNHGGV